MKATKKEIKKLKKTINADIFKKMNNVGDNRRKLMSIDSKWKEYIQTEMFVYCKEIKVDCLVHEFGEEILCKKGDNIVYLNGMFFICKKDNFDKLFTSGKISSTSKTNLALHHLNQLLPNDFSLLEEIRVNIWTKIKWLFTKDIVISLSKYNTNDGWFSPITKLGIKICKKDEEQ